MLPHAEKPISQKGCPSHRINLVWSWCVNKRQGGVIERDTVQIWEEEIRVNCSCIVHYALLSPTPNTAANLVNTSLKMLPCKSIFHAAGCKDSQPAAFNSRKMG